MIDFIKEWQTIFGIILGALTSVIGFYSLSTLNNFLERKENKRKIEISLTIALNDIFDTRLTINKFKERVTEIIGVIDAAMNNDERYVLEETNMPMMDIHFVEDLVYAKTKSYYIHNNILGMASAIKSINANFVDMRQNFKSLAEKNRFLVESGASKREQKETYKGNLENILTIMNDVSSHLSMGTLYLTRIKIYNGFLRRRLGSFYSWKYEGISFKYFKNKKYSNEYNAEMCSLERIDNLIEGNVNGLIEEYEKKFQERLKSNEKQTNQQ
jgi:hypothetical protein